MAKTSPKKANNKHKSKPAKSKPKLTEEVWSKSKKKRMRRKLASNAKNENSPDNTKNTTQKFQFDNSYNNDAPVVKNKTSALQQKFQQKLAGSHFRQLNEELYTTHSSSAFDKFSANPELFDAYHVGFREQVKSWPVNPLDLIIQDIIHYYHQQQGTRKIKKQTKLTIADFGCGDAKLAQELTTSTTYTNNFTVHSFDLVSRNDLVTACDMSNVPIADDSVDISVFCLALMGTNVADFLRECHRVLKAGGRVKIAEVRSRFETPDGKCGLMQEFMDMMGKLCFKEVKPRKGQNKTNKMFFMLEFEKVVGKPDPQIEFTAKACIYKRR